MEDKKSLIVLPRSKLDLEKEAFNKLSYSKWAISELIFYISENKERSPVVLVEEFAKKMRRCSLQNSDTSFIFKIGLDTTLDILDSLIIEDYKKMKGEYK